MRPITAVLTATFWTWVLLWPQCAFVWLVKRINGDSDRHGSTNWKQNLIISQIYWLPVENAMTSWDMYIVFGKLGDEDQNQVKSKTCSPNQLAMFLWPAHLHAFTNFIGSSIYCIMKTVCLATKYSRNKAHYLHAFIGRQNYENGLRIHHEFIKIQICTETRCMVGYGVVTCQKKIAKMLQCTLHKGDHKITSFCD